MKKNGVLFIVPTPIGNLGDITLRAIDVLKSVSIILTEDTRTSAKLLKHFEIKKAMLSYHKFNERSRVAEILATLTSGEDVAVISDAGTPGISDPANIIVKEAIANNIKIEVLPGATAFIPALVASGFDCERFFFAGFLSSKKTEKEFFLQMLKEFSYPIIFYEAPHRLFRFLEDIRIHFGNRKIVVAREISKIYETYYYTNIEEILKKPDIIKLKGEFVIVVNGFEKQKLCDDELMGRLTKILKSGVSRKTAITQLAKETGELKNRIYQLALNIE